MADDISARCVICKEGETSSHFVTHPSLDMLTSIKDFAVKRVELGELELKPLADYMTSLSQAELRLLRYHSNCRKTVVNKQLTQRAAKRSCSPLNITAPRKVGRPSTSSVRSRTQRASSSKPKEKICVFSPCSYEGKEDLHMVTTDNRGKTLLMIKQKTSDDHIRTCLSSLHEPGDAHAQEKWYHSSCIQIALRSIPEANQAQSEFELRQRISDAQLIMFVDSCLREDGTISMTDVNNMYVGILRENRIEKAENQRKYLKPLIKQHVPNAKFVQPPRRNESENIVLSELVGKAVDDFIQQDAESTIDRIIELSRYLRRELLQYRDTWKFNGKLDDFNNPPLLQFLLEQILFGPHSKHVTGQRNIDCKKTVDILSQVILQNVKTDHQVRHKPKSDTSFRQRSETPVSIGLPLSLHCRVRDKHLVNLISDMYLGSSYDSVLDLQKRVACGVIDRMKETGGYVLPSFVKKGKPVFFAVDNIDFLEDTAYGQNTLHGTLVVINQEDGEGDLVNEPLQIPEKPWPASIDVLYYDEPIIVPKPVRFEEYDVEAGTDLLSVYKQKDRAWVLANHLGNKKLQKPEKHNSTEDEGNEESQMHMDEDVNPVDEPPGMSGQQSSILDVSQEPSVQLQKTRKEDVFPTWAATNSILEYSKGVEIKRTNSSPIAPLFKQPPTNYATLYTALMLTQEISAVVVGPARRTVITLDLDLYERALKIQQSTGNDNWVLRAGELHITMAALHALAKYIEGSGLDTVAIETSIYSPAALRAIFTGKTFKRGVEYHIMNALACFYMKFDAVLGKSPPSPLIFQCEELRKSLHGQDSKCLEHFDAVRNHYNQMQMSTPGAGELATFLDSYTTQVEVLLHLIRASRQNDWEGFLAALNEQIKYFMAHDLFKYARLMPVHLAQMKALEKDDPLTWAALKNGDFCVRKSDTPFTALFVDQTLEQEIKKLKGIGGITGLTQQEGLLDRFLLIQPELSKIVADFQNHYTRICDPREPGKRHYQLSGEIAIRSTANALKLRNCIQLHCEGNPYEIKTPLKSIVSSVVVPEAAKFDILNRDEKGQLAYKTLVDERLLTHSTISIWNPMKKLKLKTHSTWMPKQLVRIGEKIIKLREERQLLARFLVIQQSRPELVPKLANTIAEYEMSVLPRSLFANDGSLLIPTDKSSLMHAVEEQKDISISEEPSDTTAAVAQDEEDEVDSHSIRVIGRPLEENSNVNEAAIIFDGMAVLQSMKKTSAMTKIIHLKTAFVKRMKRLMKGYTEGRIIFDRYLKVSLKDKTRAKRAAKVSSIEFMVHDEMNIAKVTLKELLATSKTKSQLTELLAKALLEAFEDSNQDLVVSYAEKIRSNRSNLLRQDMMTHNHEEADTMIPLHVLDIIRESRFKAIDVWSPDTDVLVLLMDLVANGHLQSPTTLRFLTGKGEKYRAIDVRRRVSAIGVEKSKGLIGLHHFTGADWGGKFIGVSKKTWISVYLSLPQNDEILQTFAGMGHEPQADEAMEIHFMPARYRPIERFVCQVYSAKSNIDSVPALRWELFRKKNLEGEKLPPTRGALLPHIARANYMAMRDKSYTTSMPELPELAQNGWEITSNGDYQPVRCLKGPAPKAVLELIKCGCRGSCDTVLCSCLKNALSCTPICKCTDCSNAGKEFDLSNEADDTD